MNARALFIEESKRSVNGPERPHGEVLFAISALADHVRACNLKQADDLLTELLVLLHTRKQD